jgi:hypothetical protein
MIAGWSIPARKNALLRFFIAFIEKNRHISHMLCFLFETVVLSFFIPDVADAEHN